MATVIDLPMLDDSGPPVGAWAAITQFGDDLALAATPPGERTREDSFDAFVWDSCFATGIDSVDQEHRYLVRLVNQLGRELISGEAGQAAQLQQAFERLDRYAKQHFAAEEDLMLDGRLSRRHRELHGRLHAEFVAQLAAMWSGRLTMTRPAEALHGFLRAWLATHILGTDQSMARQLALVRDGTPPEEAFDIDLAREDKASSALLAAIGNLYRVLAQQNSDLATANARLEDRVSARTRELAQANRALSNANAQLEEANGALAEANARLEALSNRDGLLGIANRRYFDSALDSEWRRAMRNGQPLSLLMIDVDHFKLYNDCYGHPQGDSCLQALARAVQLPGTPKRPGDLVARYGGEELVVLLPNTALHGAVATARTIQRAVADLHIAHAGSPVAAEVTLSIGVATLLPERHTEPRLLLAAADRALYAAKNSGRNRVVCA